MHCFDLTSAALYWLILFLPTTITLRHCQSCPKHSPSPILYILYPVILWDQNQLLHDGMCSVTSVVSCSLQPYGLLSPPGSSLHGLLQNTGRGFGIFLTQKESNLHFPCLFTIASRFSTHWTTFETRTLHDSYSNTWFYLTLKALLLISPKQLACFAHNKCLVKMLLD